MGQSRKFNGILLSGLLLLFCFTRVSGQSNIFKDSLLNIIHGNYGDSLRSRAMADISFYFRNVDTDSGKYYGRWGVEVALKSNLYNNAGRSENSIGNNFLNTSNYDSALICFEKANQYYLLNGDSTALQAGFNNMAIAYDRMGFPERALEKYLAAAEINEKYQNYKALASTLENVGNVYRRSLKKHQDGLEYIRRAQSIREMINDSPAYGSSYSRIADIYYDILQYDSSIYYYKKALFHDRRNQILLRQITVSTSLGSLYMDMKNLDSAEVYLHQAVEMGEKSNFRTWYSRALMNYGLLKGIKGNKEEGFQLIDKGMSIAKELKEPGRLKEGYRVLKDFHELFGDSAKAYRNFVSYYLLTDSLDNIQRMKSLDDMKEKYESAKKENEIRQLLADKKIAQLTLERKNALIAGNLQDARVKEAQIALLEKEKIIQLLKLKEQEDALEKKQLESNSQQQQMELMRQNQSLKQVELDRQLMEKRWILIVSLVIILLLLLFFYQFRMSQQRKMDNEKHKLMHQLSEMKIEALRAQMNPHFIFNALNSINRYIIRSDKETASDYLVKFSKLMRLILENSKTSSVPLSNELEALRLYVELEMLRFDHKFDFVLEVDPQIDLSGTGIPPLIFQPYVENSIWHGLLNKEGKGTVSVKITKEGVQKLRCVIEDNGVGRARAAELRSVTHGSRKSFGTQITRDRIQLLEGDDNRMAIVDLFDDQQQPAGTRVELLLNFNKAA
jgi:tetratricopeptide (TPR) repeat protein/two-component sensor histidine kinase